MEKDSSKIIFIDPSADIVEVIAKLKSAKAKEITLSFPPKSLMLQSAINLQVLAKYEADLGKTLTITTTDHIGIHHARSAGLAVALEDGTEPAA